MNRENLRSDHVPYYAYHNIVIIIIIQIRTKYEYLNSYIFIHYREMYEYTHIFQFIDDLCIKCFNGL